MQQSYRAGGHASGARSRAPFTRTAGEVAARLTRSKRGGGHLTLAKRYVAYVLSMPQYRVPSEELTQRALRAAVEIVRESGFTGLTMEGVARRIGSAKTAIYRRWPDKGALFAEAALSFLRLGEVPDTGSLEEDLARHALTNKSNQEHPELADGALAQGIPAVFDPAVFPLVWERLFRFRVDQGVQVIRRGVERGEIAADVDAEALLDCLAGLILYRQSIKGHEVTEAQLRDVIHGLVLSPPRITDHGGSGS